MGFQDRATPYIYLEDDSANSAAFGWNSNEFTLVNQATANAVPSGTATWKMDTSGRRTMPLQPCFLTLRTADVANVSGDGTYYTMVWNNEIFDRGSNLSGTTFTAPVTGVYRFVLSAGFSTIGTANAALMQIVTTARTFTSQQLSPTAIKDSANAYAGCISVVTELTAADTVSTVMRAQGTTKTVSWLASASWFAGYLIA